jgi:hypothetical protein
LIYIFTLFSSRAFAVKKNRRLTGGRKATKERNFGTLHPELAQQWHPTKNGDLTPGQVTPGSSKKVWWKCERGHEWQARIAFRTYGSGCPFCVRINKTISKTT